MRPQCTLQDTIHQKTAATKTMHREPPQTFYEHRPTTSATTPIRDRVVLADNPCFTPPHRPPYQPIPVYTTQDQDTDHHTDPSPTTTHKTTAQTTTQTTTQTTIPTNPCLHHTRPPHSPPYQLPRPVVTLEEVVEHGQQHVKDEVCALSCIPFSDGILDQLICVAQNIPSMNMELVI